MSFPPVSKATLPVEETRMPVRKYPANVCEKLAQARLDKVFLDA